MTIEQEVEQLRQENAQFRRSINRELRLLGNALDAANRGNRNHVVIDHLERAIQGLQSKTACAVCGETDTHGHAFEDGNVIV